MRAVLQRVQSASVAVGGETIASIGRGWLVFLGVGAGDSEAQAQQLADKTFNIRAFQDNAGKMNLSVKDIGGGVLVVSQFTLYADCRKGRRPSFTAAADPNIAKLLYEVYIKALRAAGLAHVEAGRFQAEMAVQLVNDGPVTLVLDTQYL